MASVEASGTVCDIELSKKGHAHGVKEGVLRMSRSKSSLYWDCDIRIIESTLARKETFRFCKPLRID